MALNLHPDSAVRKEGLRAVERVRDAATPIQVRQSARQLERIRQEDPEVNQLAVWDGLHSVELLRRSGYQLDSREVREYFPFAVVKRGVLAVAADLFGVTIRPAKLPAVLARLSHHVKTGRTIPDSLVTRMQAADALSRPPEAAFGAALSAISLEIHSTTSAPTGTPRPTTPISGLR